MSLGVAPDFEPPSVDAGAVRLSELVQHPVQLLSDDEVRALADSAVDQIVERVAHSAAR